MQIEQNKLLNGTDYQFKYKIGKGSQAEVYYVKKNNQQYAVKIINLSCLSIKQKQRLQFEINSNFNLSCRQNCTNFPYFYGYWYSSQQINLLFQLCDYNANTCMQTITTFTGRFNLSYILLYDILQSLVILQKHSIIHRDIKPQNILVHHNKLKLADLGLSRIIQQNSSTLLTTDVGNIMSRSPQFYQGNYNNMSDIWSLAINAFYICQGTLPFDDITLSFVRNHQIQNMIGRISSKNFQIDLQPQGRKSHGKNNYLHLILKTMLVLQPQKRLNAVQIIEKFFYIEEQNINYSLYSNRKKLCIIGYLKNRHNLHLSNYFLILLLLQTDFIRMDNKLIQNNSNSGKRQICVRVKLQLYYLLQMLAHLVDEDTMQNNSIQTIIAIILALLPCWKLQLQNYNKTKQLMLKITDPEQTLIVYQIKKVKQKFPLLQFAVILLRQVIDDCQTSSICLWNIPLQLHRILQ